MKTKAIRRDALYASLPVATMLQILEESTRYKQDEHRAKLKSIFGKVIPRATYYRMLTTLRNQKPLLLAEVQASKPLYPQEAQSQVLSVSDIHARIEQISKRLDTIAREQSFMATKIQAIDAGRSTAFVMYMNMRNLNRVIRNSAFVADALEFTKSVAYPGNRKAKVSAITTHLSDLDKKTEARLDAFLSLGFQTHFDKADLTDQELFMLRLRLVWGCSLIDELEHDSRLSLSKEETESIDFFANEIPPVVLFVDLWHDMGVAWLSEAAFWIYKYRTFVTPYERTRAIIREIQMFQRMRTSKT